MIIMLSLAQEALGDQGVKIKGSDLYFIIYGVMIAE